MALQLQSTVTSDAALELKLAEVEVPEPAANEVVIRVEAAPINPSDLGLLFGLADMTTAKQGGTAERPIISAKVPPKMLRGLKARLDQDLPVGNEGAGTVVKAGDSPAAQALLGTVVAGFGGSMYSEFRCLRLDQVLPLPAGTTPEQGASCFVNPLTALGMVETMRMEGHTALVHTAAASNLGQMLNRICLADDVALVNVVRKQEQVDLLKAQGAKFVVNSSSDNFMDELTDALAETGATIAFDATGGGDLGSRILTCMEAAASRNAAEYSRYGSDTFKQLYIYGGLDRNPTTLSRTFGFAWAIGGWLLPPFLAKVGNETANKLRQRVASEVTTTFASTYTAEVSLAEALTLKAISTYGKQATGEKYLINPAKGAS